MSQSWAGGPSVSELAKRMKALKAANSIDATPQRVRQKHSTAEEPITPRIRRRTEAVPANGPLIGTDDASREGDAMLPSSAQNSSIKSPLTFQERNALVRKRDYSEPTRL
jgi:hypothetical protein